MASLNINNRIKFSLKFVHRGTVVFLRYLETQACSVAHTSVEALKRFWDFVGDKGLFCCTRTSVEVLKRSLVRQWAKIPQEHYRAEVYEFQRRLDMVIHVKGGHIEKWDYRLILIYISYYTVYYFLLFMHVWNY